jgi:hypothetical protein
VFSVAIYIVTARDSRHSRHSLGTAGWWGRVFATLLFAFYINFIPIHLAAETHLNDSVASVADADLHHDEHNDDHDHHHHDSDHHTPHRASDHTLTLTTTAKAPTASALALLFLPAITSVLASEPQPQPPIPVFERIIPPGESPPDPLQPRAPPLA